MLLTSWKRFKGLEADAVATMEKPERPGDSDRANANRYGARSRAKHLLTVIEVPEESGVWQNLDRSKPHHTVASSYRASDPPVSVPAPIWRVQA